MEPTSEPGVEEVPPSLYQVRVEGPLTGCVLQDTQVYSFLEEHGSLLHRVKQRDGLVVTLEEKDC